MRGVFASLWQDCTTSDRCIWSTKLYLELAGACGERSQSATRKPGIYATELASASEPGATSGMMRIDLPHLSSCACRSVASICRKLRAHSWKYCQTIDLAHGRFSNLSGVNPLKPMESGAFENRLPCYVSFTGVACVSTVAVREVAMRRRNRGLVFIRSGRLAADRLLARAIDRVPLRPDWRPEYATSTS